MAEPQAKSPFGWVVAGAALVSFWLSMAFKIGMPYWLGMFLVLFLLGLMLRGVLSPSFKPHTDEPAWLREQIERASDSHPKPKDPAEPPSHSA